MSNKRSLKDVKELLANRPLARSAAIADAVLPKPDRTVEAVFIARGMEADWPLNGAEGND